MTIDQAGDELRPGLSATAKITTAHKPNALTIPIQALIQRDPAAETVLFAHKGKAASASSTAVGTGTRAKVPTIQGVYKLVMADGRLRVQFIPVSTGVTGATDIEVLSGLMDGDEIVTGRYKVLRSLKSGTAVKRDNSVDTSATDDKS